MTTKLGPITLDALPIDDDGPPGGADNWQRTLDLLTEWLSEHRGNSRSTYADAIGYPVNVTTGQRRDVSTLRNGVAWLPWCLSHDVDPLEARRTHVVAWIDALDSTPHPDTGRLLGRSTQAHTVSVVSAYYRWLVEEGHVEVNPVQINRKKLGVSVADDPSPTRSLTREEVAALQRAADRDRIAAVRSRSSAIVALLFGVGMRVSELVGLNLDDLQTMQGHRVLPLRRSGGRVHWVAIPEVVLPRIDAYLATRPDLDQRRGRQSKKGAAARPLFITGRGQRLHRTAVNGLLHRLARDAGLVEPESISPNVGIITAGRMAGGSESSLRHSVDPAEATPEGGDGQHVFELVRPPANSYLPPLQIQDEQEER